MKTKNPGMPQIKIWVWGFLVFIVFGCKQKEKTEVVEVSSTTLNPTENENKKVQGIVLRKVPSAGSEFAEDPKWDVYYVYDISLPEPAVGTEKNTDLRVREDDLVIVNIQGNKPGASSIDGRGMIDQELLYDYLKRTDSSFYKLKKRVASE